MSIQATAAEYAWIRDRIDALEVELKGLKGQEDEKQKELFREMAEAGISSFNSEELGRKFVAVTKSFPRLGDKMRETEMYDWLRKKGYGDIIRPQAHPSTLRATLKEIAAGNEEMPDFIETYVDMDVQIRRIAK